MCLDTRPHTESPLSRRRSQGKLRSMAKNREFQIFAKPAGPLCNLDCQYCYYSKHLSEDPGTGSPRMSPELLEKYIAQHIAACTGPVVTFSWHGGEPTVLGLDYFRRIVALQRQHLPRGKGVFNGIQTNGMLIDAEWARFLASEGFGANAGNAKSCRCATADAPKTGSFPLRMANPA